MALDALTSVSSDHPGVVAVSLASAKAIETSGGVLTLEFAGHAQDADDLRLLSAQVDERAARTVTHGDH